MKKFLVFIAALAVLLAYGIDCSAADKYIGLNAGVFIPNSTGDSFKDKIVSEKDWLTVDGLGGSDVGPAVALVYGFKIARHLAMESGVGTYFSNYDETITGDAISNNYVVDVQAIPFTLTFKGVLPLANDRLELYGGVGFGLYFVYADAEVTSASEDDSGVLFEASDNTGGFGYHAAVGGDFYVNEKFGVGLEGKWSQARVELSDITGGDSIDVGGFIITLGVKYRL